MRERNAVLFYKLFEMPCVRPVNRDWATLLKSRGFLISLEERNGHKFYKKRVSDLSGYSHAVTAIAFE